MSEVRTDDGHREDPVEAPAGAGAALPARREPGLSAVSGTSSTPQRRGMFGVTGSGDTSGFSRLLPVRQRVQSTLRPYGGWFDAAVDVLSASTGESFDEVVEAVVVDRGELTLHVVPEAVPAVLQTLRDHPDLRFELLSSLSGVDYLGADERRLHVVYDVCSMTFARRLRVETAVTAEDPHVPSATGVYPTADWHERETWDFFGVVFDGHPALTRIEMPDDWEGHPQRKDYPLGGVPVEYKGAQVPPPDTRRAYA